MNRLTFSHSQPINMNDSYELPLIQQPIDNLHDRECKSHPFNAFNTALKL